MALDIDSLRLKLLEFRDARDWKQFHSVRNLITALSVEASELLELTQWKNDRDLEPVVINGTLTPKLASEIANVLIYIVLLSDRLGIDPLAAAFQKIDENEQRYPVEKSKGSARKYTDI